MGEPVNLTNAVVTLETQTGVQIKTTVTPFLAPGANYRLLVPMDAGLTADAYKATALKPMVSFRMKVTIGNTTYLPMELHGSYASLGQPARTTHLDLTLGEDSDNDGLPDAWERQLIEMLGGGLTLADIKPGDDSDGDGMSNLQEYLAGTYAFDPADGLKLEVAGMNEGRLLFDFMVIRGRTYSVQSSTDLKTWTPVSFFLPSEGASATPTSAYAATDVRIIRVEAISPSTNSPVRTYRVLAQ